MRHRKINFKLRRIQHFCIFGKYRAYLKTAKEPLRNWTGVGPGTCVEEPEWIHRTTMSRAVLDRLGLEPPRSLESEKLCSVYTVKSRSGTSLELALSLRPPDQFLTECMLHRFSGGRAVPDQL